MYDNKLYNSLTNNDEYIIINFNKIIPKQKDNYYINKLYYTNTNINGIKLFIFKNNENYSLQSIKLNQIINNLLQEKTYNNIVNIKNEINTFNSKSYNLNK